MNSLIKNYRTICIVGLAKNTGKTTTLNALIKQTPHNTIALTSIGLDGENIDQMTYLPKPKITVYKDMVIATTDQALKLSHIDYTILEKTQLHTALGTVLIVKTHSSGNLVVAGPTTNTDLEMLIKKLRPYAKHIFIDGAFNRLTFANIPSIDAIIMATGASVNDDMSKTIEYTKAIAQSFNYKKTTYLNETPKDTMVIKTHTDGIKNEDKAINTFINTYKKQPVHWVYISGAITEKWVDAWIKYSVKNMTLIVEDATKLLLPSNYFSYLKALNIAVEVINKTNLILITINPFNPRGYHYNETEFLTTLQRHIKTRVINIRRMECESHDPTYQ